MGKLSSVFVKVLTMNLIPNLLLNLLSLHECKVAIHILSEIETQLDNELLSETIGDWNVFVQDSNVAITSEVIFSGKACIMSFSKSALLNITFTMRHQRPVKILLGDIYTQSYKKPEYEPVLVELPPIVSVKNALFSSSKSQ